MIKAIIFDMDGLMIDSERVTYEGYAAECGKLGVTIDKEFYKQLLGRPIPAIHQIFRSSFGQEFPIQEIMGRVHQYLEDTFAREGVLLKRGLTDLLKYLKEHDYKTIVATSSTRSRVDRILSQAGLTPYYDDSICGDEVQKGKPDPEIFLRACKKLGVPPCEALVLEDSEMGIEAAYLAGIRVICIPDMKYPEKEYAAKTLKILDSLGLVAEFISQNSL